MSAIFPFYIINEAALNSTLMLSYELLVSFTGELACPRTRWDLTSIGHHYFLDRSILVLRGGVDVAGEDTCPPHGKEAKAALDCNVPQHPRRKNRREDGLKLHRVSDLKLNLAAVSEGKGAEDM